MKDLQETLEQGGRDLLCAWAGRVSALVSHGERMKLATGHWLEAGLEWLDKYDRGQLGGDLAGQAPARSGQLEVVPADGATGAPGETVFLDTQEVLDLHEAALGAKDAPRDRAALESALARARNAMAYGQASAEQAGWLMAEGIVKNHPFTNGNKRTALLALAAFWEKNGEPLPHDAVWLARRILALAER